jgi:hypothetical protein
VPPRSTVWIPGGALHAIKVTGAPKSSGAFVEPEAQGLLCLSATPLLRELLARSAILSALYAEGGSETRLIERAP